MTYKNMRPAIFLERINRFVANIYIDGEIEACHVKNTGRCKELFIPGTFIYVEPSDNPNRKTKYSLISIEKQDKLFNIDSQAPNEVLYKHFLRNPKYKEYIVKPEHTFKNSRFDFLLTNIKNQEKTLIEAKGVTLENNEIALFPDAPTLRGVKHIEELIEATNLGYKAYIVFIIQFENPLYFTPNNKTHKEFGKALLKAKKAGVNILAYDTYVRYNELSIHKSIPIKL